jgi:hypothetical protein
MSVFQPAIDPVLDPDAANRMVEELTGPQSSMPSMPDLPSNIVELPGGYIDHQGVLHKDARIREINGSDEEAMARELRNPNVSVPKVVDLLLKRCVEEVGTHKADAQLLSEMLTGDRAALMLAIRILTFGNDWEVPDFPCRLCGQTFGCIVELDSSISTQKMDNPMVQEVEVELRNDHIANVALLNGAIQLEMVGDGNRTGPEEITIAIDRCIKRYDGMPVAGPMAQKMSMADRRKIATAMAEAQPGPRMEEVMVTCTECGREAGYTVSLVDLFR